MLLMMIFIADIILKYVLAYILTQFKSSVSTILQPGQSHLFIKKNHLFRNKNALDTPKFMEKYKTTWSQSNNIE